MKTTYSFFGLLAGVALVACQPGGNGGEQASAPAEAPETMPAAEPAAEPAATEPMNTVTYSLINEPTWVTLFAGQDLTQFNVVGGADWQIVDDYVESTGAEAGFLVTRGGYGDVRLQAEFWTSADANSGVFMRCQDVDNIAAATCYEVNIFDQRPDQTYRTGGIVDVAEPMAQIDAADQWNTYDITMEGNHLVVRLNDQVTVDTTDDQFAAGPIALQWSAGTVRFRNVRLRPL